MHGPLPVIAGMLVLVVPSLRFLPVPYQGACIHLPPPNHLVYAVAKAPEMFGDMWSLIWLAGVLRTREFLNDLGDSAYTLEIQSWEPYRGRE